MVICSLSGALQTTLLGAGLLACVLLSLAPYVYGDGVLRVWHAGDAGQCAREALPCVPSSRVSVRRVQEERHCQDTQMLLGPRF